MNRREQKQREPLIQTEDFLPEITFPCRDDFKRYLLSEASKDCASNEAKARGVLVVDYNSEVFQMLFSLLVNQGVSERKAKTDVTNFLNGHILKN